MTSRNGAVGRPTKLTPEARRRFCAALALGHTRADAAGYAGVKYATVHRWLARASHEKRGRYRTFRAAVKRAENEFVSRNVAVINSAAGDGTWTASAWLLERRRPADWGRKDTTKLVGAGKGGAVVVVTLGPGQSMEDL